MTLLRAMTRHPDLATRGQRLAGGLLLLVLLLAAGMDWSVAA